MHVAKLAVILTVVVLGGFVVLDGVNRGESYPALLLVVVAAVVALLPWATASETDRNQERLDALAKDVSSLAEDTAAIRHVLTRPRISRRAVRYRISRLLFGLALGVVLGQAIRQHRRR